MDKTKALALIEQQRRRWRSREMDDIVLARRAERVFFRVALVYSLLAPVFFIVAARVHIFYAAGVTFLFGGLFLFVHSRRFTEALRVLSDAKTAAQ
jgi:hypothetical protein